MQRRIWLRASSQRATILQGVANNPLTIRDNSRKSRISLLRNLDFRRREKNAHEQTNSPDTHGLCRLCSQCHRAGCLRCVIDHNNDNLSIQFERFRGKSQLPQHGVVYFKHYIQFDEHGERSRIETLDLRGREVGETLTLSRPLPLLFASEMMRHESLALEVEKNL